MLVLEWYLRLLTVDVAILDPCVSITTSVYRYLYFVQCKLSEVIIATAKIGTFNISFSSSRDLFFPIKASFSLIRLFILCWMSRMYRSFSSSRFNISAFSYERIRQVIDDTSTQGKPHIYPCTIGNNPFINYINSHIVISMYIYNSLVVN